MFSHLATVGADPVERIAANACVATMTSDQAAAARRSSTIRWIGRHHSGYALAWPLLRPDTVPSTHGAVWDLSGISAGTDGFGATAPVAVDVWPFTDVPIGELDERIAASGVPASTERFKGHVTVRTQWAALGRLATVAGVRAIELHAEADAALRRAVPIVGGRARVSGGPGSRASGRAGARRSWGADRIRRTWNGRRSGADAPGPGGSRPLDRQAGRPGVARADRHSVALMGVLAGTGETSGSSLQGPCRGVAPGAELVVHRAAIVDVDSLSAYRGAVEDIVAESAGGARIILLPYATRASGVARDNGLAAEVDAVAAHHLDDLIVLAAGNEGDRLSLEASARNAIVVGASDDDEVAVFSGRGLVGRHTGPTEAVSRRQPVPARRFKPGCGPTSSPRASTSCARPWARPRAPEGGHLRRGQRHERRCRLVAGGAAVHATVLP